MKLFYAPATISLASVIALCETGAEFEPIRLNFYEKEQTKPEYLTINPKGRVPALITDQGTLTETAAILTYIAELNPDANLIPKDVYLRAKMNEMLSYLASTVHVNHAHKIRGARWATKKGSFEDMTAKVAENMFDCFGLIEDALNAGPWIIGDQYTIADANLFTVASWLEGDGVPMSRLPNVAAHYAAMNERAAVRRALEIMG